MPDPVAAGIVAMKKRCESPLPARSSREEFESLMKRMESLEDLSLMESGIEEGLRRLGRSLAEETVRRVASDTASSPEAGFPPSGGG